MSLIQEAEVWIETSKITPRSMSSRRAAQLLTRCILRITKLETTMSLLRRQITALKQVVGEGEL